MREVIFIEKDMLLQAQALDNLRAAKILLLDLETSGLDPRTSNILLIQVAPLKGDVSYVFKYKDLDPFHKVSLKNILSTKELVIHNATFDLRFISYHLDFDVLADTYTVFDTFLGECVLGAGTWQNLRAYASLKNTVYRRYKMKMDKDIRQEFIDHSGDYFTAEQVTYAAKDLEYLPSIRKDQIEEAKKYSLTDTLRLEFNLCKVITKMSLDGVAIDKNLWKEIIRSETVKKKQSYDILISMISPHLKQTSLFDEIPFNVNSTTQLLKFLNEDYGLKLEDTAEQTLKSAKDPLCEAILEYREHEKMLSAFGETTLAKVNPVSGRLHPEFNQCMTATGRFSSDNPNVQQIPGKGEGAKLRQCFIATPGYKMICADYSQIELRILAEFSQEPKLIEAYTSEIDVHTQTASIAFGIPTTEVSSDQRKIAKIINFATVYGGGPGAISRGLIQVISREEAKHILATTFRAEPGKEGVYFTLGKYFVEAFFEGMPVAKDYLENSGKLAVHNRFSETPLGRKRFYWELDEYRPQSMADEGFRELVSSVQRKGKNHPIQGCSADITKIALINIAKELGDLYRDDRARILLQVHDEIVVEAEEGIVEEAKELVYRSMKSAGEKFLTTVPVEIEVKVSDYWAK